MGLPQAHSYWIDGDVMARHANHSPRRPATKFAQLRKKLQKAKIGGKKGGKPIKTGKGKP
jgi:hypothetical protein